MNNLGIMYSDVINEHTLNIFTDASIRNRSYGYDGCYGAIAVYNNTVIDEIYRINTNTTNNNSEIKGVRAGVILALKYQHQFKTINIFSDSQISIFGIRDRLVTWEISPTGKLIGKSGQEIQSQNIFLEIMYLMLQYNLRVNFLHQKGHINIKNINSLYEAQHVFRASNSIRGIVDLNIIRFISRWNCIVDETSRSRLLQYRGSNIEDPIQFYSSQFDRNQFKKLSENTIKKGVL